MDFKSPRISANKLAEYMTAHSSRRRKIVYDAKYPKTFKLARYKEVRDAVKGYVADQLFSDDIENLIEDLRNRSTNSDYQENDRTSSISALEHLLLTNVLLPEGCESKTNNNYENKLNIHGVEVSVFPDLLVTKKSAKTSLTGALKVHLSKENALNQEGQDIVGVLLYKYAELFLAVEGYTASTKLCFSLDVFSKSLHCCPTSYKQRWDKIEISCEEIALWWDKV